MGPWSQARVQEVRTTLQPPSASMLFASPWPRHRYSARRTRVHSRILGFLPVSHVLPDLNGDLMHGHSRQMYRIYFIMWRIPFPIAQKNVFARTLRPRKKRGEVCLLAPRSPNASTAQSLGPLEHDSFAAFAAVRLANLLGFHWQELSASYICNASPYLFETCLNLNARNLVRITRVNAQPVRAIHSLGEHRQLKKNF